jgi:hypothetical protein
VTIQVGHSRGSREPRIHYDHFRVAIAFRFDSPFETAGVVLGWISAHDQHHVAILDVDPSVRHCAPAKRWSQT